MTLFSLIYQGDVKKTSKSKVIRAEEFSKLLGIDELLEEAENDIEKLRLENEETCQKLQENAKATGHKEGLATFNSHIIYLDKKVKELQHELQKLVLPIALQAAKRIVGNQLETKPETVVDIVIQALKPVTQAHEVKILVSKEDKEILENEKDRIKNLFDQLRILSFEEREDISQGSCIIETEAGIINASLENQWRALEAAFDNFLKR
ncbi:MAG: Yop proteins translocation protein L [Chlamydiia bacterium]|nr:Yop proteins translocation protein L [Chlamydiia bacterium]